MRVHARRAEQAAAAREIHAVHERRILRRLQAAGYEPVCSAPGRTPSEQELIQLVPGCVGWIAGVEPVSAGVIEAATDLRAISRTVDAWERAGWGQTAFGRGVFGARAVQKLLDPAEPIAMPPLVATDERRAVIGQLPEERELFEGLLGEHLVDVGRKLDPDNPGYFTWWAPWRQMRQRNIGWRLDYVLASPSVTARAVACPVLADVGTSDHAPVMMTTIA